MLLSSFDINVYNIRIDYDSSINKNIKIQLSKNIIENNNNIDIFYKIFFINGHSYKFNKQNKNIDKISNILDIDEKLQDFLNNNETVIIHKNDLSDLIINYLIMYDDELNIRYCNLEKLKKILLMFLFYINEEKILF